MKTYQRVQNPTEKYQKVETYHTSKGTLTLLESKPLTSTTISAPVKIETKEPRTRYESEFLNFLSQTIEKEDNSGKNSPRAFGASSSMPKLSTPEPEPNAEHEQMPQLDPQSVERRQVVMKSLENENPAKCSPQKAFEMTKQPVIQNPNSVWTNCYTVNRCSTTYLNKDRFYPMTNKAIRLVDEDPVEYVAKEEEVCSVPVVEDMSDTCSSSCSCSSCSSGSSSSDSDCDEKTKTSTDSLQNNKENSNKKNYETTKYLTKLLFGVNKLKGKPLSISQMVLGVRKKGRPTKQEWEKIQNFRDAVSKCKEKWTESGVAPKESLNELKTYMAEPILNDLNERKKQLTPLEVRVELENVLDYFNRDIQNYLKSGLPLFNVSSLPICRKKTVGLTVEKEKTVISFCFIFLLIYFCFFFF